MNPKQKGKSAQTGEDNSVEEPDDRWRGEATV